MSANKRMCLRSATNKRQSFFERICDDLCEEILKYLPIEDRFRLEGVSKQFQRTIFKSEGVLFLKLDDMEKCKILLKKCRNVNQIKTSDYYYILAHFDKDSGKTNKYNKLVKIIIKNCNNLTDFK